MSAVEFVWHRMADERPTNMSSTYLLLRNGGRMYVARISTLICSDGSMLFHIPNNRNNYINSRNIKAWAEIPPFKVVDE